jgi:hypothetical protein
MNQSKSPALPFAAVTLAGLLLTTSPAQADTIAWTHWTSATPSTSTVPGSATGTAGSVTVTYSGQTSGLLTNYPSWTPTATFAGGSVGNAPPHANNAVGLEGGATYTETITFSSPIVDPVMSIWSLGAPNAPASFDFNASEPFSIVAGGGSAEYGGSSITQSGNNVLGREGDGTIIFDGTFSSLTFTTPSYESYYAFTVGYDDTLTTGTPTQTAAATPEPGTLALLGTGLLGLTSLRRRITSRR